MPEEVKTDTKSTWARMAQAADAIEGVLKHLANDEERRKVIQVIYDSRPKKGQ